MSLVRWNPWLRWDPWRELRFTTLPVLSDLERQMEDFARQAFNDLGAFAPSQAGTLFTPVDVLTRGDDLVVRVEIPGIDPERDVEVTVQNGMLSIRGERRQERTEDGDRYHRIERSYGSFQRTIPLPEGVSDQDIDATYQNGVLEVVVPRAAQLGAAKKVPVQVTGKAEKAVAEGAEKAADEKK
jgi:HSP20 family protein